MAMINLYDILNIEPTANVKSIQAGIALYGLREDANAKVMEAARTYLLNPQYRQAYDAKLFAQLNLPKPQNKPLHTPPQNQHHIDKKLIPTTQLNEFEHLYQFLGIQTDAKTHQIKQAIEEAILEGLNGKYIQQAREILLNPSKRQAYDLQQNIQHHLDNNDDFNDNDTNTSDPWWKRWLPSWRHKKSVIKPVSPKDLDAVIDQPVTQSGKHTPINPQTTAITQTVTTPLANDDASTTANSSKPAAKATFNRDNWYHFLGIRGDASYQEIKVAIRKAKLKGRDVAAIKQAQNILLRPATRKLYDKQNNISAFVAAQNAHTKRGVVATDYKPAKTLFGYSVQKALLLLMCMVGVINSLFPWLHNIVGLQLQLAWPLLLSCVTMALCVCIGHKQDPLSRKAMVWLNLSLLPAMALLSLIPLSHYQNGFCVAWGVAIALMLLPWLMQAQSRNVSFKSHVQQWLALLGFIINLIISALCYYQWTQALS